jgi:hypothetical protein
MSRIIRRRNRWERLRTVRKRRRAGEREREGRKRGVANRKQRRRKSYMLTGRGKFQLAMLNRKGGLKKFGISSLFLNLATNAPKPSSSAPFPKAK